jgi:hypothetical protein
MTEMAQRWLDLAKQTEMAEGWLDLAKQAKEKSPK